MNEKFKSGPKSPEVAGEALLNATSAPADMSRFDVDVTAATPETAEDSSAINSVKLRLELKGLTRKQLVDRYNVNGRFKYVDVPLTNAERMALQTENELIDAEIRSRE